MIDSYKYVNGKIVAYDEPNGIKEYDYQDNIHEILEQENVVEEISNITEQLYNERSYYRKHKKDFINMFFSEKYGEKNWAFFLLAVVVTVMSFAYVAEVGASPLVFNILRSLSGISIFLLVPGLTHSYIKYKKDNEICLLNLEQQIREFEEKLKLEKEKLNKLKNDKITENYGKNITNAVVEINNKKIETISNITRRKQLYSFFREYLGNLKRYNNKEYLNHLYKNDFTDEDIEFVNEMNETNKALSKKKSK